MLNDGDRNMDRKVRRVKSFFQIYAIISMVVMLGLKVIGWIDPITQLVLIVIIIIVCGVILLTNIWLKETRNAVFNTVTIALWMMVAIATATVI